MVHILTGSVFILTTPPFSLHPNQPFCSCTGRTIPRRNSARWGISTYSRRRAAGYSAHHLEALEAEFEAQDAAFLEEIAAKELQYSAAKQAEWEAYMATYVPPTTAAAAQSGSTGTASSTESTASSGSSSSSGLTWLVPCSYTSITSPFGYRVAPTTGASTYHQGVDLDTGTGWPVYATRAGIATTAYSSSAGNYVIVDHQDGYKSIYMHLSGFSVSSGTIVSAGQQIGLTGTTGIATGDHLHFGISYNGVYVNPCLYVNL